MIEVLSNTTQGIQLEVPSESDKTSYIVNVTYPDGNIPGCILCTCPDFYYRTRFCKHIIAALNFLVDVAAENDVILNREEVLADG